MQTDLLAYLKSSPLHASRKNKLLHVCSRSTTAGVCDKQNLFIYDCIYGTCRFHEMQKVLKEG